MNDRSGLPRPGFSRSRDVGLIVIGLLLPACASGSTATPGMLPPATPQPKIILFQVPTPASFTAGITAGPDGNVWFVEGAIHVNKIARLNISNGTITEFPITGCAESPEYITTGSDNHLWASELCFIFQPYTTYPEMARIATDGTFQLIQMNVIEQPFHETLGPDGNVWFTMWASGMVGKITPGGVATQYSLASPANPSPRPEGITVGPGGNLWIAESGQTIDEVKTNGTIVQQFSAPSSVSGIAYGPDGNLWITGYDADDIYKVTPSGSVTSYSIPNPCVGGLTAPLNITRGSDGAMWFTEALGNGIGRIDMGGHISTICLPPNGATFDVTSGPDGNIWFTVPGMNDIGEVVLRH